MIILVGISCLAMRAMSENLGVILNPGGSPWIVDPWSAPQPAESPAILRATSSRRLLHIYCVTFAYKSGNRWEEHPTDPGIYASG
jgi:hypothetical protein